jgi:hypothetical protein
MCWAEDHNTLKGSTDWISKPTSSVYIFQPCPVVYHNCPFNAALFQGLPGSINMFSVFLSLYVCRNMRWSPIHILTQCTNFGSLTNRWQTCTENIIQKSIIHAMTSEMITKERKQSVGTNWLYYSVMHYPKQQGREAELCWYSGRPNVSSSLLSHFKTVPIGIVYQCTKHLMSFLVTHFFLLYWQTHISE